jgi:enoyl-[acyl-carrier protein] reductase I
MPQLLEGKFALILGIANKWSLAYSIAQAFSREGATLALTYLGDRQKDSIVELSEGLNVAATLPCDVT